MPPNEHENAPDSGRPAERFGLRTRIALACLPAIAAALLFHFTDLTPAALLSALGVIPAWATFALVAVLPLAGFPLAPLYAYAGLRHGPLAGYALAFCGVAANLALAHPLYGALLRRRVVERLERKGWNPEKWRGADRLRMTILVASVPALPFWAQNAVLSASGIPFLLYFGVSLAVQAVFAVGGVALGVLGRDASVSTPLVIALLLALPISLLLLRRLKRRRPAAAGNPDCTS